MPLASRFRPHFIGGKDGSSLLAHSPSDQFLLFAHLFFGNSARAMSEHQTIYPVILSGGSGKRLWPLSEARQPKPFIPLIGETTLFEQALERVGDRARFAAPVIVAGSDHAALVDEQAATASDYRLIVEPAARNTAPAIALAAGLLDREAVMLVCPSDHFIADRGAFEAAALAAASFAREGHLVAFGIKPQHPETGYGYLKRGEALASGFRISQFVEKPDLATARAYLESGEYSWNGGIFAFRAGTYLDELARFSPDMASIAKAAMRDARHDGHRIYPDAQIFAAIEGQSIDYAVMEKTGAAVMVPVEMGWSDIGNFASLKAAQAKGDGQTARGRVDLADCTNVMALSDGPRISAVGLSNCTIIVANGEVLVTSDDGAPLVGKLPGANSL